MECASAAKTSLKGPPLFQILPSGQTGLARLAAEAEHAHDGHSVEFRTMEVRSVLNRLVSKRQLSLDYSINPYRGCEFGCRYCYARYTHEFLAPREPFGKSGSKGVDYRNPESFEQVIFLKQNAAWLLEQELRRIGPGDEIALGTATDPYQPVERKVRITRSLLEVFARRSGHRLGIVTKSKLIERDIDLLVEIARRNTLVVHLTITTPDAHLARILEPRAPSPVLRFSAVKRLREAGLTVGILCSPLLPGITDSEKAIDGMVRRAAAVDASFFAANPLFLKPCSRPTYFDFIREHFPALLGDYERRFGSADFAAGPYRKKLADTVQRACRKYRLRQRYDDASLTGEIMLRATGAVQRKAPTADSRSDQQKLFA